MLERKVTKNVDWVLISLVFILIAIGVTNLYSATYRVDEGINRVFITQCIWVLCGILVMIAFALFDYRLLDRLTWFIYFIMIVLLVYVLFFGKKIYGASRWIDLQLFLFQPSEIAKIAIIIVIAKYFKEEKKIRGYGLKDIIIPSILVFIPTILILKEPDLGTALLVLIILGSLLIFVGLRIRSIIMILISMLVAFPILWFYVLKEYQKDRIRVFLDPARDKLGDAWHITQSLIAVGSGKLLGKGFLEGTQSKLEFVPKQHTDFIFSVFSEEWGFVGGALLLLVFCLLFLWGLNICGKARDRFGAILATGIILMIFWQVIINIGMELDLLPVVGMTLPFFSYGGSSFITTMIGMGILLNISMRRYMF